MAEIEIDSYPELPMSPLLAELIRLTQYDAAPLLPAEKLIRALQNTGAQVAAGIYDNLVGQGEEHGVPVGIPFPVVWVPPLAVGNPLDPSINTYYQLISKVAGRYTVSKGGIYFGVPIVGKGGETVGNKMTRLFPLDQTWMPAVVSINNIPWNTYYGIGETTWMRRNGRRRRNNGSKEQFAGFCWRPDTADQPERLSF